MSSGSGRCHGKWAGGWGSDRGLAVRDLGGPLCLKAQGSGPQPELLAQCVVTHSARVAGLAPLPLLPPSQPVSGNIVNGSFLRVRGPNAFGDVLSPLTF